MTSYVKSLLCLIISSGACIATSSSTPKRLELLQLQVIHRHGDRTPITPTNDESFWEKTLPSPDVLNRISHGTVFIRDGDEKKSTSHSAGGNGAFGQLTTLGLMQLVELGSKLRSELHSTNDEKVIPETKNDNYVIENQGLFSSSKPMRPQDIRVHSTNFPRTIQSVQGLLIGLFPERSTTKEIIEIDIRNTDTMIPDPQPRRHPYQIELEQISATRPHLLEKEEKMKPLAMKVTDILRKNVLGSGADGVSFGVGEKKKVNSNNEPLSWSQLAELTTCLRVRNKLPSDITIEEQELISAHAAWRWFENLRHPELSKLAMGVMLNKLVDNMFQYDIDMPSLYIYSAHDSTLIGLLCAFELDNPSKWPEYASCLKIELLRDVQDQKFFVRFSLNDEILKCNIGNSKKDLIPLNRFKGLLLDDNNNVEEQKI